MSNNHREPDGIRRKRKRRAPMSLEEIERSRNIKFQRENRDPENKKRLKRNVNKNFKVKRIKFKKY